MRFPANYTDSFTKEQWQRVHEIERASEKQNAELNDEFFRLWNPIKKRYDKGQAKLRGVDRAEYLAWHLFHAIKKGESK